MLTILGLVFSIAGSAVGKASTCDYSTQQYEYVEGYESWREVLGKTLIPQDSCMLRWYLEAAKQRNDRRSEALILTYFCHAYKHRPRRLDEALAWGEQSLTLFRELEDKVGEARALYVMGRMYARAAQPLDALQYYLKVEQIVEEHPDWYIQTSLYNSMGTVYKDLGDYGLAGEYYNRGFVLVNGAINTDYQTNILQLVYSNNLADLYLRIEEQDSIDYYYQQALQVSLPAKHTVSMAYVHSNYAQFLMNIGEFDRADHHLLQADSLNQSVNNNNFFTNQERGRWYCEMGAYDRGIPIIKQQLQQYRRAVLPLEALTAIEYLADFYARQGNHEEAYRYLEEAVLLRDTLKVSRGKTGSVNVVREFILAKSENEALKLETEKEKAHLHSQRLQYGLLGVLLFLGLSWVWLYSINVAKKKLQRSEQALSDANIAKERLMAILAHDLRSPLDVARKRMDTFLTSSHQMSRDQLVEVFSDTDEVFENSLDLTNTILNWAAYEQDRLQYSPSKIDVATTVSEAIHFLHALARDRIVTIDAAFENVIVETDERMLGFIVRNLLQNAIKFSPVGGTVYLAVKERTTAKREVEIIIKDEGPGMSTEEQLTLFDPSAQRRSFDGRKSYGLGLYLVNEFANLMGASLQVKSKLGEGSSFHFIL